MQSKEEDNRKTRTENDKYAMRAKRQIANHEMELVRHPVETRPEYDREDDRSSGVYSACVVFPLRFLHFVRN